MTDDNMIKVVLIIVKIIIRIDKLSIYKIEFIVNIIFE